VTLRDEVVEAQKVRTDMLKWKLISVGTLATIGFGIAHDYHMLPPALCLIPFVALYCDAVCYHQELRIRVISVWLKRHGGEDAEYEAFADRAGSRARAYDLEDWVISYGTLLASALLVLSSPKWLCCGPEQNVGYGVAVAISGLGGIGLSLLLTHLYSRRWTEVGSTP
jgi:hypothetical protein